MAQAASSLQTLQPTPNPEARGFTLLEVLLAVLLITFSFAALSQAFSLGLFFSGDDESLLVANNLAQEKMEEIRNKIYSSIANEAKAAVTGFPVFQREVVVTTPQSSLKQVNVNVYWYNKSSELNTGLVTYVSN